MKGTGLLKLCVLSLFTLGISYFGLLKSSYANATNLYQLVPVGLDKVSSDWNSQYQIGTLKKSRFLSTYLGTSKSVLALDNQRLLFRGPDNGLYYYYNNGGNVLQGYYQYIFSCNEITLDSTGDYLSNCSSPSQVELGNEIYSNFLGYLTNGDYVYVAIRDENYIFVGGNYYYTYSDSNVCFSSHALGSTLCFVSDTNDYNGNVPRSLTGSLGLGTDVNFGNINRNILSEPPNFVAGESIEGGSQVVDPNTTTGDVMTTNCTKSRALSWYRANGYKSRMCYSSYLNTTDLYTGPGDAVGYALTGVDIMEIRFNTAGYRRNGATGSGMPYTTWFDYWRKTYEVYQKNPEHTNPFLGVPVSIFTLMGNVESYGLPYSNASIIEFCDLSLYTADYTKPYTGIAQNTVCSMSAIDVLETTLYNTENPDDGYPGYGNTALSGSNGTIGSSRQGITNRTGFSNVPGNGYQMSGLSAFTDGKSFQNNFFNLLKSSFKYIDGSNQTGFIPSYIIIFLCGLIIFRFLSH